MKRFLNIIQRGLGLMLGFTFLFTAVSVRDLSNIYALESTEIMHNLVLFAQFDSTAGYNFMLDRTDEIQEMCNSTATSRSLKSYINTISYGKLSVDCVFPQLQDGVIMPYTLSGGEDGYTDETSLAIEVLQNIDIPDDMNVDGNNDGVIDNIIIVVDGEASGTGDFLWPKAFSMYGLAVDDYVTGYVNIHNSNSLFESLISGGVGVLCHEFLHSIGYPDLYRQTDGNPVGSWDIMASTSVFLQYPLAYQRASVSGWLDTTEITEDGSYTIQSAASDNGERVYILKTPLSDTEFFAVEYRCKGTQFTDEMDTKIYGTGLVVYRINTEVNGNYRSDRDGIYVFRPDETDVNSAQGDISSSYYGGTGMANYIGTADFSDTISDGAIVYSDGTNSGICIENIVLNGKSASFDVSFADTQQSELWKTAGDTSAFDNTVSFDMETTNDFVYLLTSNGASAQISRLMDGQWVKQGTTIGGGGYGSVNDVRLAICNDEIYALYHDSSYAIVLCKLETDGSWSEIYHSSEAIQYADMSASDDKISIAYTTGSYPYVLSLMTYNLKSGTFETNVNSIADNACNISIASTESGKIVIAYRDLANSDIAKAAIIDDGNVQIIPLGTSGCGTVSANSFGENVRVAVTGDSSQLYEIKNNVASLIIMPEGVAENCFSAQSILSRNGEFIAVNTQNNPVLSIYRFENSNWVKLGNDIAQEIVNDVHTVCLGTRLYSAYISDSEKLIIKQIEITGTLKGDVNLDGLINDADVLLLNDYIVGKAKLNSAQVLNADVTADNSVDVFDLTALKAL